MSNVFMFTVAHYGRVYCRVLKLCSQIYNFAYNFNDFLLQRAGHSDSEFASSKIALCENLDPIHVYIYHHH